MYRNNGRAIGERLVLLRDYLIANADKEHAVSMEEIQVLYENNGFEGDNGGHVSIQTVYRDLGALRDLWDVQHSC